jgi:IS30 family transposase
VLGHWEGDLLFGGGDSQIATLVDRHTQYVMLVKIARKDTRTVIDLSICCIHRLKPPPKADVQILSEISGRSIAWREKLRANIRT